MLMMFIFSQAYKFEEDFQSALEGYSHASLLDPSWSVPESEERQLIAHLNSVKEMIEAKVFLAYTETLLCVYL